MSKLYGLVVRWLFVSTKGITIQILGVVGFKNSTLTVYCLSSWFVNQKLKTYTALFVLCRPSHLSWFQELKYMPPSVWLQVTNHDMKSKNFKKWFQILQQGNLYEIHGQTSFQPNNLENSNNNFIFWLRIWLFGGLAVTSLNQFEKKSLKITLHGNWNCSAPKTGTSIIKVSYDR